jgi:hypothetical protein
MKKTKKSIKYKHSSKRSIKTKKTKKMKGGSVELFIDNKKKDNSSIVLIGSGAQGLVYFDKNQKNVVFKVSDSRNVCRDWLKEANIYDIFKKYDVDEKLCKFMKMNQYATFNNKCYLELLKVNNPLDIDADYTIQPCFGIDSMESFQNEHDENTAHRKRGLFLGIKELIVNGFFTEESIKEYIAQLGVIIARLHYQVNNDGFDIELFLDKTGDKITVYIADFDLSNFYETINDEIIKKMVACLDSVPYFPTPDQPELFAIFSDNYINEAKKFKQNMVAQQVMHMYE